MYKSKRAHKRERGQSLVEVALLFPLLLILLLGLLDFGRAYYAMVSIRDAADEGASYAAINPDDLDGIRRRAAEATVGLIEVEETDIFVSYPDGQALGSPVVVRVDYEMTLFTPFVNGLFPEGLILHGESTHAILSL